MERHAVLLSLSASGTPHQMTEAVSTRGCQRGPPDCEATGSDTWPGTAPGQGCVSKGASSQAEPSLSWLGHLSAEGRQILFYEVWHRKANCLPLRPKAFEWQKWRRRRAQTPGVRMSEWIYLEMNLLVNLVWVPGCFHLALFNPKLCFPGF